MRQKDLPILIFIIIFSAVFSVMITKFVIIRNTEPLKAEQADTISSSFEQPDNTIFNADALNPTQLIKIGDNPNAQPNQ